MGSMMAPTLVARRRGPRPRGTEPAGGTRLRTALLPLSPACSTRGSIRRPRSPGRASIPRQRRPRRAGLAGRRPARRVRGGGAHRRALAGARTTTSAGSSVVGRAGAGADPRRSGAVATAAEPAGQTRRRRPRRVDRDRRCGDAAATPGRVALPRLLDVAGDLLDERASLVEARSSRSRCQSSTTSRSPVEVAVEVEQVRLDAPLVAAVVRVRADRDRRPAAGRGAGVDAVRRHEQLAGDREVRGREAERAAARVAARRRFPRPPAAARAVAAAASISPARSELADRASRRRSRRAARARVEARARRAGRGRRCGLRPKRKSAPATTTSAPIAPSTALGERLGRASAASSSVEGDTSTSSIPRAASSSSRRSSVVEELDAVAEHRPRVRVERDDGRREPRVDRARVEHPPVPAVDAVEGADRDRPRRALRARGIASDVHGTRPLEPRRPASASGGRRTMRVRRRPPRRGTGPTSVRRSVAQCPPSASAIARTYVPELTAGRASRPRPRSR